MVAVKTRASACAFAALMLPAWAWGNADVARSKGVAWLLQQQRGDGSWSAADQGLGVQATSAALLALKQAGLMSSPSAGAAAGWLANADSDSIDSMARKVEGLAAAGLQASAQSEIERLYALRVVRYMATWGGYGGNGVDHMDSALGLMALRVGDAAYLSKANASVENTIRQGVCHLVGARVAVAPGRQAWPLATGTLNQSPAQGRPSVVATALLMHELRSMQVRPGLLAFTCGGQSTSTVLSEAQAWLLDQQNADGGFGEQRTDGTKGASNVLVTAWVHRALGAMGAPAQSQMGQAMSWLLAQQDGSTGAWRNDPLVTASVVAALPAAVGAQVADADQDGISDVVEAQLGSDVSVADARQQLDPPSLSVPGVTAASFSVAAMVGQPFSHPLGPSGAYAVTAGSLPPGLALNASSGVISGIPTQAGTYSFDYQSGSGGAAQLVIGRIDVAEAVQSVDDGDVPLPGWALLVLGASLLGALRRRVRAD